MKKLILISFILILLPAFIIAQEQDAKSRFYSAIVAEEIEGDLDKAINIYEEILKNQDVDRQLAAKSLYHLGICHDKKESGKAMDYFVSLLEKYPDQGDLADLARNRISKLEDANTFIDPRDGHKYKYIQIGNQIWMAENLAYMPHVNPAKKQENGIWVYDYDGSDVAEAKATENYQKYGCLYDWPTAMALEPEYLEKEWKGDTVNHQGICSPGWHMPTDYEWKQLEMALGMPDSAAHDEGFNRAGTFTSGDLLYEYPPVGRYLKSSSGWNSDADGNNKSNFNVLPSGTRYPQGTGNRGIFLSVGDLASFWTSSEDSYLIRNTTEYKFVWNRYLYKNRKDDIDRSTYDEKGTGNSIRCIKNYNNEYPLKDIVIRKAAEFIKPIPLESIERTYSSPEILWELKSPQASTTAKVYKNQIICNSDSSFISFDLFTGNMLWEKMIGNISPGYFIEDNRLLYISDKILYCVNIDTWAELWQFKTLVNVVNINVVNEIIVCRTGRFSRQASEAGTLYCINLENGNLLWEKPNYDIIGTRLALSDNLLLFGTANMGVAAKQNYLVAIELSTGEEKWKYPVGGSILSDPVVENDIVVFGCTDEYVYALDLNQGSKVWRYFANSRIYADPTIYNNTVFIGDLGEMFDIDGTSGSFHAIDLLTGEQKWKANRVSPLIPDGMLNEWSFVYENTIITAANRGSVFAFDIDTGETVWKYKSGSGIGTITPVNSDGIIVLRKRSGIYAIKPPKE